MRIAIIGNSGSGKSTLARWLAARSGAALLDLDTLAWERESIAVARTAEAAGQDVRVFCAANDSWIIEDCYANLVRETF
jgi:adenylate kinase family enzyme